MLFVRTLCLCLAVVVFATSCSSATLEVSGDDAAPATSLVAPTTAAPTTVAPSTVAPTTVPPTTIPSTTVPPSTVAPPVTTTPDAAFEIKAEHVDYCALASQAEDNEAAMGDDGFLDPERLEPFVAENLRLLEEARPSVPDEIADDFLIFIDGQYEIERVLAASGFDFLSVVDDPVFADPEFEAAAEAVESFGESACGFIDDAEPAGDGEVSAVEVAAIEALLEDEVERQAFIASLAESMGITEEEGACFVEELGAEKLAAMAAMDGSGAPDNRIVIDIFAAFEVCGIEAE